MSDFVPTPKIVGRHKTGRTEIELHVYRAEGNGIPLPKMSGVELICEQFPENGRRKLFIAPLHWDAVVELHAKLGEILARSDR